MVTALVFVTPFSWRSRYNKIAREVNILSSQSHWEQINYQERLGKRLERERQKKEDNHWKFLAGDLVARYLKSELKITVHKGKGATAKNAESFKPLENILAYLAEHREFMARIMAGESDVEPGSY